MAAISTILAFGIWALWWDDVRAFMKWGTSEPERHDLSSLAFVVG